MVSVFLVLFVVAGVMCDDDKKKIGAIFYEDASLLQTAFELSARMYNFDVSIRNASRRGEVLEISQHVCSLAMEGVVGIIDGTGGRASEHAQAVCDVLELPHVLVQHNDLYATNWTLLNLFPSTTAYNGVLESLILHKDWSNFTLLYVKGRSTSKMVELMKMGNSTDRFTVTVRELSGNDYRDVLIGAKNSGFTNFVVDCPSENLKQFLVHAQQVGIMAEEYSFIFLSPDLFTLDLSDYRYGGVNITGLRILDVKKNVALWDFTNQFNELVSEPLEPEMIKTEVILIHDAVKVFSEALTKINVTQSELSCQNYDSWVYGSSLLNFMRTNKIEGISKVLIFDGLGLRTDVFFDILELTPAGNQSIGSWEQNKLRISRPFVPSAEITGETRMRNKTFKILIAQTPPYGYVKESAIELEGNERYEGFTVDLIERLSEMLGFNYEFEIENSYGQLDANGKWNGMVQKIREEKADFGICDFTITAERQSAVDFSTPFMTLGIGILYKQPSKQPPKMFSFMEVFSKEVWINMLLVQLGLGVIMIFVGRISHKEWQNPVPCIEQPEEFSNQFSFANSIWLIIGSVMQQGTEIAPIAVAPRVITSVWWFFTMVMVASYTGTLVAFLTVEKNVVPFETVEELANQKSISYGAKAKGSTISFFKDSKNEIYQNMYKKMEERGWLVSDNDIAVEKAENTTYAAFMESTSIEYYKERHCDLLQVGGLLDSKSYGIGMKKGSEYKKHIDDALLKLKETGEIQKLKDIWWKEKRGGGKCGGETSDETKQLGMKNMLGAFVVLGVGCLIGLFISTLDMLWGVFKKSLKYQTSFRYELIEELKFALKFSGDIKPVKRPRPDGSTQDLSLAEANGETKDELMSLKSVRSSDTQKTHHSHSSKHSSRCQSVAFARLRDYK